MFHKKLSLKSTLLAAVLLAISNAATANDTSIGDDNGSIVFKQQADISMDKEELFISQGQIRVSYVFTNTGKNDLNISMAFPMPPKYFGESDHSEIQEFKLWVNDSIVKTDRKMVVLLNGNTDISSQISQLGWSESDLETLLAHENAPTGKKPLPEDWFDKGGWPLFTLNEYYIWQQAFPVGKPVAIRHSYSPSVTSGVPQPAQFLMEEYAKITCMDKNARAAMLKRDTEGGVLWAYLRYILLTANNWQGPIKDFKLTIEKQSPTELISLCFDGDLHKVDSQTFEFSRKNYRPTQDLSILFFGNNE
jgi:hypothetical protein